MGTGEDGRRASIRFTVSSSIATENPRSARYSTDRRCHGCPGRFDRACPEARRQSALVECASPCRGLGVVSALVTVAGDDSRPLLSGKIPLGLLARLLAELPAPPPELRLGAGIGEDACAIEIP